VQRRTVTLGAGRVHAIRIDGIPLRRAYTPLVETILRALDPLIVQATQARVALVVERSEFTATTAHLDGEKIAWALVTLVGNALRHTTAGGTIHVRLRSAGSEHLELTVEDNGAGIPEARLRHLFEHDPATGRRAGLALVLVRDIVVAHGGTVAVSRGKHGKGSLFSLQIPLR
jgi:signal transduction histidine kinase